MVWEGLDTIDVTRWVHNNFGQCGLANAAESGAVHGEDEISSSSLTRLASVWHRLPEATRDETMALLKKARESVDW